MERFGGRLSETLASNRDPGAHGHKEMRIEETLTEMVPLPCAVPLVILSSRTRAI